MKRLHLTSKGLGAHDIDVELGPLTLLVGPNASSKSSVLNAIRHSLIGHVPHLGKELQATALLMRNGVMQQDVELWDGRVVARRLERDADGALHQRVECSWKSTTTDKKVHAAAAVQLCGETIETAAQSLDNRVLFTLTGPKRAACLEKVLHTPSDPNAMIRRLARLVYAVLSGTDEDRIPNDYVELERTVDGYDPAGNHTGKLGAAKSLFPMLHGKLKDAGLDGAAGWVNEQKNERARDVREATQALADRARRLQEIPEPDAAEIARLEARRSQLEQQVGAANARREQIETLLGKIVLADQELARRTRERDEATGARAAFETTKRATLEQARRRVAEIDAALDTVTAPARGEDPELARLAAAVERLQAEHDGIEIPEAISIAAEEEALRIAAERVERARTDPWATVALKAGEISAVAAKLPKGGNAITILADELRELAAKHLAVDAEQLERDRVGVEQALTAKRRTRDQAARAAELATTQRAELTHQIGGLRELHRTRQADADAAFEQASQAFTGRRQPLLDERGPLQTTIAELAELDTTTAAAVTATTAALQGATDARNALGPAPEAAAPLDAQLSQDLTATQTRLATLLEHDTLWREHREMEQRLALRTATHAVLCTFEASIKRVRAEDVANQGGPLLQFLGRYLRGAGRTEVPFVRAEKDVVDFGWRDAEGRHVSVSAMNEASWTLYATGVCAAAQVLREVELRLVLVEAAGCDQRTLEQLLNGIASIADELTAAIVCHWYRPETVPDGWALLSPTGAVLDQAA